MNNTHLEVATGHGYSINSKGGIYERGKSYDHKTKLNVASAIKDAQFLIGSKININAIDNECKVHWHFVKKVEKELELHNRVLTPDEVHRITENVGAGSKTLEPLDISVIIKLYLDEPSRSLPSYRKELFALVGTNVSVSTLSRLFKELNMSMCRPNGKIPLDKFSMKNACTATEYVYVMSRVDPFKIKFGDEKALEGKEVYDRGVRRNPFTGKVPAIATTACFTERYSLTGFCGIDRRTPPVFCVIHEGTNDAIEFGLQIQAAIEHGFLRCRDILVLDNASIHTGGVNSTLEDWLWDQFEIALMLLPPRSPELNPIELVWNTLVQRLKCFPLPVLYEIGSHSCAVASLKILEEISHEEVERYYKKCYSFMD